MAINGDGFFSVQKPTSVTDNVPVFDGVTDYTRRGDFQVNANGNLVNGAGYYLMGVDVDPKTGNPTGNVPHVLQFQNNFVPAQATTCDHLCREPADATEDAGEHHGRRQYDHRVGGLNPSDFASNPLIAGTPAPPYTERHLHRHCRRQRQHRAQRDHRATQLVGTAGSTSNDLATAITTVRR